MRCPKCGKDNRGPASSWAGGKGTKSPMKIQRFNCAACGSSYVSWKDSKTGRVKTMIRRSSA